MVYLSVNFSGIFTQLIRWLKAIQAARSKTWKPRKSRKSWKLFPEIFKSKFSILAIGQNRKLGNKKTRNNISEISEVSEFSICHFFIFQKTFFQYSKVGNSVLYIYVMYCFQSLLKCFFLQQKNIMFKILPCRNKIYLLWNRCIYTKTPVFFNKLLKKRFTSLRKKHA